MRPFPFPRLRPNLSRVPTYNGRTVSVQSGLLLQVLLLEIARLACRVRCAMGDDAHTIANDEARAS